MSKEREFESVSREIQQDLFESVVVREELLFGNRRMVQEQWYLLLIELSFIEIADFCEERVNSEPCMSEFECALLDFRVVQDIVNDIE